MDMLSYLLGKKNGGGETIPKSVEEFDGALKTVTDNFLDYLNNDFNDEKNAYTDQNITLYTPDAEFSKYMIYKANNKYKVAWIRNYVFVANGSNFATGSIGPYSYLSIKVNSDGELYQGREYKTSFSFDGQWQDNLYLSNESFDTLEDIINAMSNDNITYSTNAGLISYQELLYSNWVLGLDNNPVYYIIETSIISHNETIVEIGG